MSESHIQVLPVVPLRDMVVFPRMKSAFVVGRPASVASLQRALDETGKVKFIGFDSSEALVRAIPGSQLNVIPHAGHLVAFEQPDKFNHVLEEWLDRVAFAVPVSELR